MNEELIEQQGACTTALPDGYELVQDEDGDWVLTPPEGVTIFSSPGEGWLVSDDYMAGRDWDSREDVLSACVTYIQEIERG